MKAILILFSIAFSAIFSTGHAQSLEELTKATWHSDIPGSWKFNHCYCFSHYLTPKFPPLPGMKYNPFPNDTPEHPIQAQDIVWHRFMQGLLKANLATGYSVKEAEFRSIFPHYGFTIHYPIHLSQYLQVIHKAKLALDEARIKKLKLIDRYWTSPRDLKEVPEKKAEIQKLYQDGIRILNALPNELIPLFHNALEASRSKENDNLALLYNSGLVQVTKGDYASALKEVSRFIELADRPAHRNLLHSDVFQIQGECYFEVGRYHEAVEALTNAIQKDPENKEAYLSRAFAYFEAGQFDQSLKDYLTSGIIPKSYYPPKPVSSRFLAEFIMSLAEGTVEGCVEFVPNLCHTACGLGRVMWDCAQAPVESTEKFASACLEVGQWFVDYCKTLDKETIEGYVDDLKTLYAKFDELDEGEKGKLIGHVIGKYGVEIFAGTAIAEGALALKGAEKAKKLRDLNRACTMEAMASSPTAEKKIVQAAIEHTIQREAYFQNVKLHQGAQNKHLRIHSHFIDGRSILEYPDPAELLKKVAGKGRAVTGVPGAPGYKEVVDCGEYIGLWVKDNVSYPTTRATIHYSKKGAHIVPAKPNA